MLDSLSFDITIEIFCKLKYNSKIKELTPLFIFLTNKKFLDIHKYNQRYISKKITCSYNLIFNDTMNIKFLIENNISVEDLDNLRYCTQNTKNYYPRADDSQLIGHYPNINISTILTDLKLDLNEEYNYILDSYKYVNTDTVLTDKFDRKNVNRNLSQTCALQWITLFRSTELPKLVGWLIEESRCDDECGDQCDGYCNHARMTLHTNNLDIIKVFKIAGIKDVTVIMTFN